MSQADYQVAVFDTDGNGVDLIDMSRVQNLRYTRVLNGIGEFDLTFVDPNDRAFDYWHRLDYLFEIYRRNEDNEQFEREGTYLRRYADIFENEQTGFEGLILGGFSLEHFLARRRIDPNDDPDGGAGFSTKAGFGDAVMTGYVRDQCVEPAVDSTRIIDGLSVAPTANIPYQTFQRRKLEDKLIDVLIDISEQARVGGVRLDFQIRRLTGASFLFETLQRGTDRSIAANFPFTQFVLFAPERGNLSRPRLTVDRREEITYAWVGGQGPEEDRAYAPVIVPALHDSRWNRIEDVTDSRENDDLNGLISAGYAYLEEKSQKVSFTFAPDPYASQGKYNVDWTLGDIVSASYRGFTFDYRIQKVTVTVNQDTEDVSIELLKYVR